MKDVILGLFKEVLKLLKTFMKYIMIIVIVLLLILVANSCGVILQIVNMVS